MKDEPLYLDGNHMMMPLTPLNYPHRPPTQLRHRLTFQTRHGSYIRFQGASWLTPCPSGVVHSSTPEASIIVILTDHYNQDMTPIELCATANRRKQDVDGMSFLYESIFHSLTVEWINIDANWSSSYGAIGAFTGIHLDIKGRKKELTNEMIDWMTFDIEFHFEKMRGTRPKCQPFRRIGQLRHVTPTLASRTMASALLLRRLSTTSHRLTANVTATGEVFYFHLYLKRLQRLELNWIDSIFHGRAGLFCSLTLCQLTPPASYCRHGSCVLDGNQTERCQCDAGFTGPLCDSTLSACDLEPCGDRGKCVPMPPPSSPDSFICQCHPWWQGKYIHL